MTRIAINGFGRIGRLVFKKILQNHSDLHIVAINDLADAKTLAALLQHDSNYGAFDGNITPKEGALLVNGKEYKVLSEKDIAKLPWKDLEVDIVLECTGAVSDLETASKHIKSGAKKVIISAPTADQEIPAFVLGVNEGMYNPVLDVVNMGSCTTNCLAVTAKVLNDTLGIEKGFMTTVHSYTNDQKVQDLPHKDLRRARAAATNMIPTTTGAASTIGKIIPELNGKLDGISIRVPTPVVSLLDLTVETKKSTTKEEVNALFKKAVKEKRFKGILAVEQQPLVSSDFKGNSNSAIIDLEETMVNANMVKVLAWYDNEWGYSCRLAEFAEFVAKKL